jgi:tRNA A-37 threonylcarbamoyl transferase component Bud32
LSDSSLLFDRYEYASTLGEGGFSKVVKALDTKMEREVAIKIIRASRKTGVRALREAKTVALLNHPNIVTLHEFEEDDKCYYLIMEYVEGESLAEILDKYEYLPAEMAMAVTVGICDALESAHASGVIHRDIKPANIHMMNDGRIKVMDFGIARLQSAVKTGNITTDGDIVGTFAYMSPEQSRGEKIDERSDIFSLGVLLYEAVTGRLPFEADTPAGTIHKIVNKNPIAPAKISSDISPALSMAIMKALAKDPDQRFASATEFKAAVEQCRQSTEAPAAIIQSDLEELRLDSAEDRGAVATVRGDLRIWLRKYSDTILVTAVAGACAIIAAWSSSYLPFADASLKMLTVVAVFFTALFIPALGLAGALALITAGLWHVSIYLGILAMVASVFYWFALGKSHPYFAVLPLLVPALAWLHIPFLFPLMMGVIFGPMPAGILAGLGALTLAIVELVGHLNYTWMISSGPAVASTVKFTGEATDTLNFISYFFSQSWLLVQIAIWGVVAFLMGSITAIEARTSPWVVLPIGAIGIWLSYRLIPDALALDRPIITSITVPLVLSVLASLLIIFVFVHPKNRSLK